MNSVTDPSASMAIVMPVFNDWSSFVALLRDLDLVAKAIARNVTVLAVDDGSTEPSAGLLRNMVLEHISTVELISLGCNLGHQRAIAIGISECVRRATYSTILVMDCDGEDAPADILKMLQLQADNPSTSIVARRAKRSEGCIFRAFYELYKLAFRCLTGEVIDFGNFCMLTAMDARRLVYMPESWNHLAAALVKSKAPVLRVNIERGVRYSGTSRMKPVSLVVHGFGAISVFNETVLTRMLLVFCLMTILAIGAGLAAVIIRLFTGLAIPGWATNVFTISVLLFFQSLTLLAVIIFGNLNNRSSAPFIPGLNSSVFCRKTTILYPNPSIGNA